MSLETDIQANTAAILELTAAILGNKAAPAPAPPKKAAAAPPATKPAAAPPPPPTPTREAVTAACVAVNGARGQDTAKKAIKQFGKADMLKDGAIVIDVAINRIPAGFDAAGQPLVQTEGKNAGKPKIITTGDVEFEKAKEVASFITPVPGGVGPVTVAMLLRNTIECAKS